MSIALQVKVMTLEGEIEALKARVAELEMLVRAMNTPASDPPRPTLKLNGKRA